MNNLNKYIHDETPRRGSLKMRLSAIALVASGMFNATEADAARNFVIKAGQTLAITSQTRFDDFYNQMVLEDGARLIIEVPNVVFHVGELIIGNDVRIIGNGKDGANGAHGKGEKPTAGVGHGGWPGENGEAGQNGQPGANFEVIAGTLRPIGVNFRVELQGGNGGNGGNGSAGGHGGTASCIEVSGDGGPGGKGGRGGDGGDSGKFSIRFSSYSGPARLFLMDPDIFIVDGGAAGLGGSRGGGGHGGRGVDCPFFLGGSRGGGRVGGDGLPGQMGKRGTRSPPEIKPI